MTTTEEFSEKVFTDFSGTMVTILCALGDRLGLFKILASKGPVTSSELAKESGLNERYIREWLFGLGSAEYLEYDSDTQRFALPGEFAPVLAEEAGPYFMGGGYQQLLGLWGALGQVMKAFRKGGGISMDAYDDNWWVGLERDSASYFNHALVQEWIPALPELEIKLKKGISVADIGSGYGRAIINLAKAYPNSRFVGYDVHGPSVTAALEMAQKAGLQDRVSFKQLKLPNESLPEEYDLITCFDVIHDTTNPRGVLKAIRNALKSDGTFFMLEIKSADNYEKNKGAIGTVLYGYSVLYCMPTALLDDGEGLGTMGMPPGRVTELCTEAGFSSVKLLPFEDEFHNIFEIKP